MNLILGIDPGLSGAVALISSSPPHNLIWFHKFRPPPDLRARDIPHFIMSELQSAGADRYVRQATIVLEDATAFPSQSISSAARLTFSRAVLQTLFHPVVCVSPSAWKRKLGLRGGDKFQSIRLARPWFSPKFRLNHDLAEAVLIAFSHTIPHSRPQPFQ